LFNLGESAYGENDWRSDADTLSVNNIKAVIFPNNIQFMNGANDKGFFYPADSVTSTMFSYGLWIGGNDSDENLHLAAETYNQNGHDFWAGPLSDDGLASITGQMSWTWMKVWNISREQVNNHIAHFQDPNYQIPEVIESWPAHGDSVFHQAKYLAPFIDVDLDDEYHPELGDYPFIKGDQTIFFIYNDQLEHSESGGASLGVEIQCMAWAISDFENPDPYKSTMFFNYKIINRSQQTFYDTFLGVFADIDIGNSSDDFIGCHVNNGNFYGYNGDDYDEHGMGSFGYGENIPTQSVCILGGPFIDADDIDNPLNNCDESINGAGFGDGIIDNERYGMENFIYFNNGGQSYQSDPTNAPEYYSYMQNIWKDESYMVYGGNGHPITGGNVAFPTHFMFPGDSDLCNWGTGGVDPEMDLWTEETANNTPDDRRGLASMGPFTFEAGSVQNLDIALVTASGNSSKNSKDLVQDYISQIKQDYLVNPNSFGNQYVGLNENIYYQEPLLVYPNPCKGDIIRFKLPKSQEADYNIYNTTGQIIEKGELEIQEEQKLNISHLKSGWYILEIKTEDQVLRAKLIL